MGKLMLLFVFLAFSCSAQERTFQVGERYRLAKQMYGFGNGDTVKIVTAYNDNLKWRTGIKTIHPSGNDDFDMTLIRRDHEKYLIPVDTLSWAGNWVALDSLLVGGDTLYWESEFVLVSDAKEVGRLTRKLDTFFISPTVDKIKVIVLGNKVYEIKRAGDSATIIRKISK